MADSPPTVVTCSDCKGQLSTHAASCPHCGAPGHKPPQPAPALGISQDVPWSVVGCSGLVLASLLAVYVYVGSRSNHAEYITTTPHANAALTVGKELIDSALVMRYNLELRQVYVLPSTWNGLTFTEKEIAARSLDAYFENRAFTRGGAGVDIMDGYSGKRLAAYSDLWGFRVD